MMKSQRTIVCIVFVAVIATGMLGLQTTRAQKNESTTGVAAPETNSPARTTGVNPDDIRKYVGPGLAVAGLPAAKSIDGKIRQAAEKVRDAEDDKAKANARQELTNILGQYFDDDMARREKELAKLEERLRKLSAQLERRRAKRQDIIELQIQVAVNEVDGLGFLSRPAFGNLPGQSSLIEDYGGPSIKISDGEKSLILRAPRPHRPSSDSYRPSPEQHQQSTEEPETGGD